MSGKGKVLQGVVVSDAMDKTVVVQVDYQKREKRFKKTQKGKKRVMAHDHENRAKAGNQVIVQESRPWSKNKAFTLVDILETAAEVSQN